jgi:hypothetical protein
MNFIHQEQFADLDLLQEIYNHYKDNPTNIVGTVGGYDENNVYKAIVDPEFKDSTDNNIANTPMLLAKYILNLTKITDNYVEKFPSCNYYGPWSLEESINIQFYKPGQAYHKWHTERFGSKGAVVARHLVFMTYLNDVTDGGETEFLNQNLKIKPKKGLTLIWPADWTYTHRGLPSPTQEKAIITGWFHYQ